MKEATGEFSMTVVTILAILVISGLIAFLGPKVKTYIERTWNQMANDCPDGYTWTETDSTTGEGYCKKVN